MRVHPSIRGLWSVSLSFLLLASLSSASRAQDDLPAEIDADGVQTLTRGPVHEAFASPTVADPEPGMIISKRPPEDIREQPPEFQPEGQNVQWFPGYWAWDEDRDDFIWISGAWRDPPPGKRWVPGYWGEVPGGFQWVAGFWIDDAAEEFEYQKPPPQSLEQGPSVASPGDDHFYVPGNWMYVNNDYNWQPGYYAPYREDWVYCPARWAWTPRGCIFVNGYWDWRVPRRGQIFAPVFFNPVVYQRPTFFYTPRCTINTSNLFVHLWVRPNYSHYYFGNYYGQTYANRHFTPWCNYQTRPRCYDPLLTYCNTHYRRQGVNYSNRMQGWHSFYDKHEHERPANTWKDQIAHHHKQNQIRPGDRPGPQPRPIYLAEDLKDVIRKPDQKEGWKRLDGAAKDVNKNSIAQIKQLHNLRLDQEKVSFVNTAGSRPNPGDRPNVDRPNVDRPNLNKPSDKPDLTLPGNTRPGRPNRPADEAGKPAIDVGNPNNVASATENKPGKFKLPKPALVTTKPGNNKPLINVPETPDKTIVNRPTNTRPGNDLNLPGVGDKPNKIPGLRPGTNPGTNPLNPINTADTDNGPNRPGTRPVTRPGTRPEIGGKLPSLDQPANGVTGNNPLINPGNTKPLDVKPLEPKPVDPKPTVNSLRPGRDPKPLGSNPLGSNPLGGNVGGNEVNKKPGSSSAAAQAQARLEAMRAQQQEQLNKLRNPGNNVGGNTNGIIGNNKPVTPRVEPRIETPRVDKPKVNLVPNNPPRNFQPTPKPTIDRTPAPRTTVERPSTPAPRVNPAPRVEPRVNPVPRVEPRSNPVPRNNPGNNQNNTNEKKRGR